MTYGVLMAHARAFFPDRILGRGARMEAAGSNAVATCSTIHFMFGLLIAAARAIYFFSRDMPLRSLSTI
jgi:hypothetical protein